jgi:hypothetical protein
LHAAHLLLQKPGKGDKVIAAHFIYPEACSVVWLSARLMIGYFGVTVEDLKAALSVIPHDFM